MQYLSALLSAEYSLYPTQQSAGSVGQDTILWVLHSFHLENSLSLAAGSQWNLIKLCLEKLNYYIDSGGCCLRYQIDPTCSLGVSVFFYINGYSEHREVIFSYFESLDTNYCQNNEHTFWYLILKNCSPKILNWKISEHSRMKKTTGDCIANCFLKIDM